MSLTISGNCLCGKIRYDVSGPPITRVICHCDNCRRSTGSAFMANNFYKKNQLQIHNSEGALLRTYLDGQTDSKHTVKRSFCGNCGSHLFITNDSDPMLADAVIVTTGTMDRHQLQSTGDGGWAPEQEFFCKRRAKWIPEFDGTKKCDAMK
ncbi:DUF636 domain protein [Talaromyces proteolyticus]|uniref:DUF636 domain protein n=1 Tax=Talaromyces proteolyticus TaxID=1131652 RepID=A0AAD4KDZ7_9EURO|nr:DUF636 domain protein [Talaromyces proteolyticus]KAH8689388.1 DUF636 domain protein [Talaromyces proteolyticus]